MSQIQEILIAGKGIAAWLSASFLSRALNAENKTVHIKILAIEPDADYCPSSATLPGFKNICQFLGWEEMQWMEDCQASFSLGSRFDGWSGKKGVSDDSFWQVYGRLLPNRDVYLNLAQHWLHEWKTGLTNLPFAKALFSSVYLCESNQSPKRAFTKNMAATPPYGFHVDPALLTRFLRNYAIEAGVELVDDFFAGVALDEAGKIQHILTSQQEKITADLFLDCTDSHRLLISALTENSYQPVHAHAPTNRIAVAKKTLSPEAIIKPYRINKAVQHGWISEVENRKETTMAFHYNAAFLTDEQAAEVLLASGDFPGKVFDFFPAESGSLEKHWVKNCVAIGGAAAYLQPMVPVNITLIQLGLNHLMYHFPDTHFHSRTINQFNEDMHNHCRQIRDFGSLNYALTEKNQSPFWKAATKRSNFSEQLQHRLAEIKGNWSSDFYPKEIFQLSDYLSVCAGHFFLPEHSLPLLKFYQIDHTFQRFQQIVQHGKILQTYMQSQNAYFEQLKRFKEFQNKKF